MATGLLPICLGQATKLCGLLLDSDKRYAVRAKLGERTDTADADGTAIEHSDGTAVSREQLEAVLPRFTGAIQQIPPMYSALKHQGRRLYELAREGQEIERAPRSLKIHELRVTGFESGHFELDVRCSKGTYIRSLVEDLAAAVGQCAHVTVLRRLESAPFNRPLMYTLDFLTSTAAQGRADLDSLLLPALSALTGWPQVRVESAAAKRLSQGQAVTLPMAVSAGRVAILGTDGALLGLGESDADNRLTPKRWLSAPA